MEETFVQRNISSTCAHEMKNELNLRREMYPNESFFKVKVKEKVYKMVT